MIRLMLMGGLGNQMFQYAYAKALSIERKTELTVDLSYINNFEKKHKVKLYGLNSFEMVVNKVTILFNYRIYTFLKTILIFLPINFNIFNFRLIVEGGHSNNKNISKSKKSNIYLFYGYWQNYRYFQDYEEMIKKDFTFSPEVRNFNHEIAELIKNDKKSVSIHIRRGDYVNKSKVSQIHGNICNILYYKNAIEEIEKYVNNPNYYIFSDDIYYVKNMFAFLENATFIENQFNCNDLGHKDDGINDMYLMSLCSHNIIANSSFSWWAAYLNCNINKKVVSPKKWMNDNKINIEDIIPTSWITVSNT